jgi:hypothetical protein
VGASAELAARGNSGKGGLNDSFPKIKRRYDNLHRCVALAPGVKREWILSVVKMNEYYKASLF